MEFHCALSALKCCQSNQSVQQANVSQVVCLRSKQLLADNVFFLLVWLASDRPNHRFFQVLIFKNLPSTSVQSWRLVFTAHTVTPFITTDSQPSQDLEFYAGPCTLSLILLSPSALFLQSLWQRRDFLPSLPTLSNAWVMPRTVLLSSHSTGSRDSSCLPNSCSC